MNSDSYRFGFVCTVCAFLLSGCSASTQVAHEESTQGNVTAVANYDALNKGLAERVRSTMGIPATGASTQILVTTTESGIGSVYRTGGRWIPYDDSSCLFSAPPKSLMPSVFVTYQISKTIAADVGLDSSLIQALAKFDVNISDASSFSFSIADASLQVVADNTFSEGLSKPACASALKTAGADLYVVRGYVSGKRAFTTGVDTTRLIQAGVKKIATFDINAGGGKATLTITDAEPMAFLQILELIPASASGASPAPVAAAPTPAPPPPPSQLPAVTSGTPSIIYIQQNAADDKSVGVAARDMLVGAGLPVETGIESLKSTPLKSQVKYFRDADQAAAARVAGLLAPKYGKVDAVRASAPKVQAGQVEVWLAKQ